MHFNVNYSYNLDLLNSLNILTQEEMYLNQHKGVYERIGANLSKQSKEIIKEIVNAMGMSMIGPLVSLVVSAVPDFEDRSLVEMFSDPDLLQSNMKRYSYYDEAEWSAGAGIFDFLIPVIEDLEANGFRQYWEEERLPQINQKKSKFQEYANKFSLDNEIELMLGKGQAPESMTVYLCSFAAPHGIKLCGPKYITDIAFTQETSLGIAIHEMFHPPYDARNIEKELELLGSDPLLQESFENKDPRFGYPTMNGFIEENVVEAMAISICHKIGLEKDPLAYFEKHDGGSHKLSVVLFEYFKKFPKSIDQTFEAYFVELLQKLPVGSLDKEYQAIVK